MRINFLGELVDEPEIKAGFIGCGSHSFRNLYPAMQFTPVDLVAVCDLKYQKAEAFAAKFGAKSAYSDYRQMLKNEKLDAVFICIGYDDRGRPLYPPIANDCLEAGCHVWMEKPPAVSCGEVEEMQRVAKGMGKNVVVGFKKIFAPANEKACALVRSCEFGQPQLVTLQYPLKVPEAVEFHDFRVRGINNQVNDFLDHICHPASLMIHLLGMPESLHCDRSSSGAGIATFRFASGSIASIVFTQGSSLNGGMERTLIVSDSGQHVTVENNIRVTHNKLPPIGYGDAPYFYGGGAGEGAETWEPEFSLGQLYNKGLFILGYYNEVNEFARSILDCRPPQKGTLDQAWMVTRIFEAFAEGPGKDINLKEKGKING